MPELVNLLGVPRDLLANLQAAAGDCGVKRLALVGGAVRDALLHHVHRDPWRGLPDLDLVVEGSSEALATTLRERLGVERVPELRVHGSFGTVELVLDGFMVDVAQARKEHYPSPGQNPLVEPGCFQDDLVRRDFTINAMALVLHPNGIKPQLLDLLFSRLAPKRTHHHPQVLRINRAGPVLVEEIEGIPARTPGREVLLTVGTERLCRRWG